MKWRIIPFLFALAGLIILLAGCSDNKETPELLSIEKSEFTVEAAAGNKTIATFDARANWTAATDTDWLTVSPGSGIARTGATITIAATENPALETRTGYVVINCGSESRTLTITQQKKEVITWQSRKQIFIGRNGGNVAFSFETNIDEPLVEIPDDAKGWLSRTETEMPGKLEFSVKPNNGGLRKTSVKIGNSPGSVSIAALVVQTDTDETNWENYYYTAGGDLKEVVPADAQKLILFGSPDIEDFKYMCDKLTKLSELDLSHTAITEIPGHAFYNESQYKNYFSRIVFPATLTRIGEMAFYECYSLGEEFRLPEEVQEIGAKAFYGCVGFSGKLTLPETLKIIGSQAFYGCSGFTGDLIIPGSVTSIGPKAFTKCEGFDGNRLILSEGITEIGESAFAREGFSIGAPQGFTSLVLPSTLKKIGNSAFSACTGITEWHLPEGLTDIGSRAFSYCDGLTQLALPSSLRHIGSLAFVQCLGFKGPLILPDGLISIGEQAFQNCPGFTGDLVIPNSVTSIGEWAFCDCTGLDGSLTLSENLETLPFGLFMRCQGLKGNLVIPKSVKTIEAQVFSGTGFTGPLVIPDGITEIGGSAFGDGKFEGDLIIPNSVTIIGGGAFRGCSKLGGKLVIPASVTTVGVSAFVGCSGFTDIYCYLEEPFEINPWGMWEETSPDKKLYVPAGSVEKYKAYKEWREAFNDGANIFPIPE